MLNINRHTFIASMATIINAKSYLELGTGSGENISFVKLLNPLCQCDGVDINNANPGSLWNFHRMKTDDFFQKNVKTYDLIFIDADHEVNSVLKDLEESLKVLNQHGLILLHDTNPQFYRLTQATWCGNAYKINEKLSKMGLNFIVLPLEEAGITIVQKNNDYRCALFGEAL